MQAKSLSEEEQKEKLQKKSSKFDNVLLDALYNIIAYIPAAIITWFISNFEL
jgi:hypothetical protein